MDSHERGEKSRGRKSELAGEEKESIEEVVQQADEGECYLMTRLLISFQKT